MAASKRVPASSNGEQRTENEGGRGKSGGKERQVDSVGRPRVDSQAAPLLQIKFQRQTRD